MDLPILFIHSPFDGRFNCFYLLANVNSVAVSIHVQVSFEHLFSVL